MNPVISIKKISKKYKYGNTIQYLSLRDSITSVFNKPGHIFKNPTNNKPLKKNEFWALKNISFEVSKGETIGLIGANGAGKSTLLKILSRITPPTEGSITLKGRVASLLEVGTGFHQELTGRENIYLNGAMLGMSRKEITNHFDQIVDFAGTKDFLDTPIKRYSSGMRVRLAFAVAAHLDSEILLVDEVLAVGDVEFQNKCINKMSSMTKDAGRTIIYVSHNLASVSKLCQRSVLLEKGKIKQIGPTDKVIETYLSQQTSKNKGKTSIRFRSNPQKNAQVTSLSILDHNQKESSGLDMAKPFYIKATIRSRTQKARMFLGITNDLYDKYIFQSHLGDGSNQVTFINEGLHKFLIKINPLLNEGTYSFKLSLVKRGVPLDVVDRALEFHIYNYSGLPYKSIAHNSQGSLVVNKADWKLISSSK